jgi:hypothetical protein
MTQYLRDGLKLSRFHYRSGDVWLGITPREVG